MAHSTLPLDQWGVPVQALAPVATKTVRISITGSSLNGAIPAETDILRVASNVPCYIRFGTGAVSAANTDMMFPAGAETFAVPEGATHLAVIQDGAVTGALTMTAMD